MSARSTLRTRAAHAGLAALAAGGSTALLPFFPHAWPLLLAALAALAALRSPALGLALALAAPAFPLGNLSLGLALAYLPLAAAWFLLHRHRAETGLLYAAGGLLTPYGGLTLLPLAVLPAAGPWRRALQAGAGALAGSAVAALLGRALPLTGEPAGSSAALAGLASPADASSVLLGALAAHPAVPVAALVVATAAAIVDLALARGAWGLAIWGSAYLAGAVLLPAAAGAPDVRALALAFGIWAAALALGVMSLGQARPSVS